MRKHDSTDKERMRKHDSTDKERMRKHDSTDKERKNLSRVSRGEWGGVQQPETPHTSTACHIASSNRANISDPGRSRMRRKLHVRF